MELITNEFELQFLLKSVAISHCWYLLPLTNETTFILNNKFVLQIIILIKGMFGFVFVHYIYVVIKRTFRLVV